MNIKIIAMMLIIAIMLCGCGKNSGVINVENANINEDNLQIKSDISKTVNKEGEADMTDLSNVENLANLPSSEIAQDDVYKASVATVEASADIEKKSLNDEIN